MTTGDSLTTQEVDLTNCDREPIHLTTFIQPHGVLLVIEIENLIILQASNNTKEFLGVTAFDLIGKTLNYLFSQRQITNLTTSLAQENILQYSALMQIKISQKKSYKVRCNFIKKEKILIIEIEPVLTKKKTIPDFYSLVKQSILKIKNAANFQETTEMLVKEVRKITGCDRVTIYRFEPDDSGVVIAESRDEKLRESFLNLHYPASDIPKQARKLYYQNWLRLIVDFNYQPVEIIPANNPLTGQPTDLSFAFLRSISPIHIEYAKNMGLAASMTISLIDEQKLWGLIVCHNYTPKYHDYKIRNYCELLGQMMSLELAKQQQQQAKVYQEKINNIQSQIKQNIAQSHQSIHQIFKDNSLNILELVQAQGAAIFFDSEITLIGETPSPEAVKDLINWFLSNHREEIYFTNSLSRDYPPIKKFKDQASGLLAISIFVNQTSYHIFWFRRELIHSVNWGGNPHKPVLVKDDGTLSLSPRRSFELWRETVSEKSFPWQQVEIDAAYRLRDTLMLTALEFSQVALEQAAEKAEIANRAKSEFLSRVSHELRTPLNAILGYSQLMNRHESLSAQQKEHVQIINRSGEHLLNLINDVLEMSKIEAGQQTVNKNNFNLYKLLDSLEEVFQLKASAKGLKMVFEKDPFLPIYIITDESKLRQVLMNLLDNAIKFTQIGKITLKVTHQKNDSTISFQVSDTGLGIEEAEIKLLFAPFVQTYAGIKSMQGTGLGLSISRQFVRLMGGELSLKSVVDSGSTFYFNIPVTLGDSTEVTVSATNKTVIALEANQPSYRLLIVEDVEDNRRLLSELLKNVGFEIKTANNGSEAIEIWKNWKPHLILMDMLMPVMNGTETTKYIKATPQGKKTLIFALTANAFSEDQAIATEAGCDDFITKPYREEILFAKIAEHLKVAYRYQEEALSIKPTSSLFTLNPEDLTVMPPEWILELQQATSALDDMQIIELIEQIPPEYAFLTKNLTELVENFHFNIIFDLTEQVIV